MTDILSDGSVSGVIIWDEDSSRANLEHMRRADFTVDSAGALTYLNVDPDPLDLGDPGVPDGHNLLYFSPDVWGNSTHSDLYLLLKRQHGNLTQGGSHGLWIYNLNDLSDQRKIYESVDNPDGWTSPDWSCPEGIDHPEAVAGCYRPESLKWNPTGTAIYRPSVAEI